MNKPKTYKASITIYLHKHPIDSNKDIRNANISNFKAQESTVIRVNKFLQENYLLSDDHIHSQAQYSYDSEVNRSVYTYT